MRKAEGNDNEKGRRRRKRKSLNSDLFVFFKRRVIDLLERALRFNENRSLKILGGFTQSLRRE